MENQFEQLLTNIPFVRAYCSSLETYIDCQEVTLFQNEGDNIIEGSIKPIRQRFYIHKRSGCYDFYPIDEESAQGSSPIVNYHSPYVFKEFYLQPCINLGTPLFLSEEGIHRFANNWLSRLVAESPKTTIYDEYDGEDKVGTIVRLLRRATNGVEEMQFTATPLERFVGNCYSIQPLGQHHNGTYYIANGSETISVQRNVYEWGLDTTHFGKLYTSMEALDERKDIDGVFEDYVVEKLDKLYAEGKPHMITVGSRVYDGKIVHTYHTKGNRPCIAEDYFFLHKFDTIGPIWGFMVRLDENMNIINHHPSDRIIRWDWINKELAAKYNYSTANCGTLYYDIRDDIKTRINNCKQKIEKSKQLLHSWEEVLMSLEED